MKTSTNRRQHERHSDSTPWWNFLKGMFCLANTPWEQLSSQVWGGEMEHTLKTEDQRTATTIVNEVFSNTPRRRFNQTAVVPAFNPETPPHPSCHLKLPSSLQQLISRLGDTSKAVHQLRSAEKKVFIDCTSCSLFLGRTAGWGGVPADVPGDSPIRWPLPLQPPRPCNFLTATPRPTFYKSPSAHIPDPASNPPGFLFPSDKDQVRVSLSDPTLPAFAALFHPESPFRLSTWTPKMYCVLSCFPEALKRKPLSSSRKGQLPVPSDGREGTALCCFLVLHPERFAKCRRAE